MIDVLQSTIGDNWFYHVHAERKDDDTLSYSVTAKESLSWGEWSGGNVETVGESSGPGLWKTVTNRTNIGTNEFIRLQVEQN